VIFDKRKCCLYITRLLNINLTFGSVEVYAEDMKAYEEFGDAPIFTLVRRRSGLWIVWIKEIEETLVSRRLTGFPLSLYVRARVARSSRCERSRIIKTNTVAELE
jgi:hypothetical protein